MQNENEEVTITIKTTMKVLKRGFAINFKYDYDTEYETESDYSDESDEEFDDKEEVWMDIDGYDNYMVSSFGNVYNVQSGRVLKFGLDGRGYQKVVLCKNGKTKTITVHKLVANAFIDNPDNKQCVDHIDNDRTNNHVSNLRWATYTENQMNKSKMKNNTSGVIGVRYVKSNKKWRAQIRIDGKIKHIGYFKTLEEAKHARIQAVNMYFGEFAHQSQHI